MSEVTRRSVLTWGAAVTAGLVSSCAAPSPHPVGVTAAAAPTDAGPVRMASGAPLTAPLTARATAGLTRAEVIHTYDRMVPTSWGPDAAGTITSLGTSDPVVALTFDACGGPTPRSAGCGYDRALIGLLRRYEARATLFLNARWIAANPAVADELAHDPLFEIGNHGTRHRPLSVTGRSAYGEKGTRSVAEAYDEVAGNHEILTGLLGHPPRFFRSGTACCDDVAVRIAGELGERVVSFTVNGDGGATFTAPQVATALHRARGGEIVISHLNRPTHQTGPGYALGLPRLLERGLRTVTLSEYLTA
ncbi:polysaccharide deacetylase family protein [Nostocoides sp. HKS02]|uniref:polysaccharide deacetylase family protein n=1 Tax=Nostocoides sp. HKS02 TaxID=1813880 RepID=UPI0012B487C6|nr:polysaccharide deacetylase family protein [Tetrasphaera sp. HKS02]QGN57639.1 polysaccharide deacetylase family protein [Tetrasphaera sp. HKS02]